MQVSRQIKGNAALDDVDHALGRPFRADGGYRNHYATSCPDQIRKMDKSDWWDRGVKRGDMVFFHVSSAGRLALAAELKDAGKYGRLYEITYTHHSGSKLVTATTASQAKYRAWIDADIDVPFIEYSSNIRARLA